MKNFGARRLFEVIILVGLFGMAARNLSDPDLGWHLRTGQYILQSHTVPHADFYSFTNFGKQWIAHEWLSELLMYAAYATGHWLGLLIGTGALITSTFWLLYKRCAGKPYIAGIVTIWCAVATIPFWGPRPQVFSMLLTSAFFLLLDRFLEGHRKELWLTVPLMAVWVNLHGGFAIGLGLIFLTALGLLLEALVGQRDRTEVRSEVRTLALVMFACLLVIPLNPNGLRMYAYPFETLHSTAIQGYIDEWASPDFHVGHFQPFALLLLATFIAIAGSGRRIAARELLLLILGSYAALRSSRHIALFVLIAGPILAAHSLALFSTWKRGKRFVSHAEVSTSRSKSFVNLGIAVAVLLLCSARVITVSAQQQSAQAKSFPAAAVDFIRNNHVPGPIYNNYDWGGYFIWHLYPDYKVFVDGRSDLYGDAFLKETVETYLAQTNWHNVFSRFGIRSVCVGRNAPLATVLRNDSEWQTVFEDDKAVILVHRAERPSEVVLRH